MGVVIVIMEAGAAVGRVAEVGVVSCYLLHLEYKWILIRDKLIFHLTPRPKYLQWNKTLNLFIS